MLFVNRERRNRRLARDFCLSWPFNVSRGNRKQSGFHYCAHFRLVLFKLHQRINYSLLYPCPNAGKYRNVTLRCLFRIFNPIDETNTLETLDVWKSFFFKPCKYRFLFIFKFDQACLLNFLNEIPLL